LLPVQLGDFKASRINNTVKLEWNSLEEVNSASYTVERSADGMKFTAIGSVPAKGVAGSYTFTDASPLTSSNYYRLKPVDRDGKFSLSKIVKVNFSQLPGIRVSPNPASSYIYVSLDNINAGATLQLVDMNGRILQQSVIAQGTVNKSISVGQLARGLYTVKVISAEKTVSTKLLLR